MRLLLMADGKNNIPDDTYAKYRPFILQLIDKKIILESSEPVESSEDWFVYYSNRFIESVFFSITGCCNARCRHCFMDACDNLLGEANTSDILRLIDEIADCGVQIVDITGGDPLVRKDFWQITEHLQHRGIAIRQLYTNGFLIDQAFIDELIRRNIKPHIIISFDGLGWHDWMRGIPGAENKVLETMRLCIKNGITVSATLCLFKGNIPSLLKTIHCLSDLGVSVLKIGPVSDTELWIKNSCGNQLSQQEFMQTALDLLPVLISDPVPMEITWGGMYELSPNAESCRVLAAEYCDNCGKESGDYYLCEGARASCYITPDLRLLPCMPMTSDENYIQFPTITEAGGFRKCISEGLYATLIEKRVSELFEKNEVCGTCEYRFKCRGGCRASAFLGDDHDYFGTDHRQCFYWKNHYDEKIKAMIETAYSSRNNG
ncbi:MAG: radical SAM protein [Clostridia bacterium]|nr:radical SAM protein [Clostridia bacterium]